MAGSSQELEPDEFAGIDFPFDTPTVVRLTEYAVPLRYDELLDADPPDREVAVTLVAEIGDWANHPLDASST